MYDIEEFDKQKLKVVNYIMYKKRTEQETRKKFENVIEENLLDDIIEYVKEAGYLNDKRYIEKAVEEYINLIEEAKKRDHRKSAYNILKKKSNTDEKEQLHYLQKKGYLYDNIKKAIEKIEEEE